MKLEDLNAAGLGHDGSAPTAIKYLEQQRQAKPKLVRFMNPAKERLLDNE